MKLNINGFDCSVIDIDTIDTKTHYGFIYVTINKLNGKRYIGKKAFRLKNGNVNAWRSYLGSGKEIKIQIQQYGKENFTRYILALARTSDELTQLEIEYIKMFNAHDSDQWLNVRIGTILNRKENPNLQSVAVYENDILIGVYESVIDCANYLKIPESTIRRNAKNNTIGKSGLLFKYVANLEKWLSLA